jgi:transposase
MKKDITKVVAVGIDVGDKNSQVCAKDASGAVVWEKKVRTTEAGFRGALGKLAPCRIVIEAGGQTRWIKACLETLGHEVKVADARKLRRIFQSESKSDVRDARELAEEALWRWNRMSVVMLRSGKSQEKLAVLKARDVLVRARTAMVNVVRSVLKQEGVVVSKGSPEAFAKKAGPVVPEGLRAALDPVVRQIAALTEEIRGYDRRIETAGSAEGAIRLLRTVTGVGPVTSAAFVWTLDDPGRFAKSRTVGAFLGLRPRRDQSGDTDKELPITKTGNGFLRRLLVGSAQYILGPFGPDTALRAWGLKLAGRGGKRAKRRAVVAVARKLSVILHRMWVTGEVYVPFPQRAHAPAA